MSKILISGCGISWSMQERPTWVKVLRLCNVDIDDQAGPAISNQMILNNMISLISSCVHHIIDTQTFPGVYGLV